MTDTRNIPSIPEPATPVFSTIVYHPAPHSQRSFFDCGHSGILYAYGLELDELPRSDAFVTSLEDEHWNKRGAASLAQVDETWRAEQVIQNTRLN